MDGQELHRQIDHIFRDLLPAAGMTEREEQIVLCHRLLNALLNGRIALCDAGTGIGKTYAYLVAGFVFLRFRSSSTLNFRPLIISTSNIALQTELQREYIPMLANLLVADGWNINLSELSVIRKGKSHYVCEQHLERRLRSMTQRATKRREKLLALQGEVDLDRAERVSNFDKNLVQVPRECSRCKRKYCRYLDFLEDCGTTPYLFQICNHNLFLADALRRHQGYYALFPDFCAVVIDEAHKLPDAARDMLKLTLDREDFRAVIQGLNRSGYQLASERLTDATAPLLKKLDEPERSPFQAYARLLSPSDRMLRRIRRTLQKEMSPSLRSQMDALTSKVSFFCNADEADTVLYTEKSEEDSTMLGATLPDIAEQLRKILWKNLDSALLVSGTLAIHEDFTRCKNILGLRNNKRTEESVSPSPFDYNKNCRLYFPITPITADSKSYLERLTDEIVGLLNATNGHALALFTSYSQLTDVKMILSSKDIPWHIYATSGNAAYTVERFRKDPGSVLLATGSLWEGMNFPGDVVSLLIIPRLPFAYPDAMSEFEQKKYDSLQGYIQAVALPDMLTKLRQGFGRAIRTETDTCVVAILDERAAPGRRYHHDILSTLPEMRITRSLRDVEEFIRRVKSEQYFKERNNERRENQGPG